MLSLPADVDERRRNSDPLDEVDSSSVARQSKEASHPRSLTPSLHRTTYRTYVYRVQ